MKTKYQELFTHLSKKIDTFNEEVKRKKLSLMATNEWTVKDVLCHIVFWHENYAANYQALAKHEDPLLPEGMSTINKRGVSSLRKNTRRELIGRLQKANKSLKKSIIDKQVPQMTYSKGGQTYKTDHFLEMIARHIETHTKQVKRAK